MCVRACVHGGEYWGGGGRARAREELVMVLMLPCRYCMNGLYCVHVGTAYVLRAAPDKLCDSKEHQNTRILAIIGLTFYTSLFAAFLAFNLFRCVMPVMPFVGVQHLAG